jgi:AcrR family transcriptional regulator
MNNNSVKRPIQERAHKTKSYIIRAAYDLISENGYHEVTVRMISKRAGVALGAPYKYFKDKIDIFKSVIEMYSEILNREIKDKTKDIFLKKRTIDDALLEFIEQTAGVIQTHQKLHIEIIRISMTNNEMRKFYSEKELSAGFVLIDELFRQFEDQIKVRDRNLAIFLFHKCAEEIIQYMLYYPVPHSPKRIMEELAFMMERYLVPE